jgi:hypothetical protein
MRSGHSILALGLTFVTGLLAGSVLRPDPELQARAQAGPRVFELRTYTTEPGRLDALHARFRDHTMRLFQKQGMTNVGYWVPQDPKLAGNTLVYLLAYPDRESATKSWEQFRADPEWQKARAASEADGRIVAKVDSLFLEATEYSPMK